MTRPCVVKRNGRWYATIPGRRASTQPGWDVTDAFQYAERWVAP